MASNQETEKEANLDQRNGKNLVCSIKKKLAGKIRLNQLCHKALGFRLSGCVN